MRRSILKSVKHPQIKLGVLLFLAVFSVNLAQAQSAGPGFSAAPGTLVDATNNSLNNANFNNGNLGGAQGSYQAPPTMPTGNFYGAPPNQPQYSNQIPNQGYTQGYSQGQKPPPNFQPPMQPYNAAGVPPSTPYPNGQYGQAPNYQNNFNPGQSQSTLAQPYGNFTTPMTQAQPQIQQGMVEQNQTQPPQADGTNSSAMNDGWTADFPSMSEFKNGGTAQNADINSQPPPSGGGTGAVAAGIGSALVRTLGTVMATRNGMYGSPYGSPYGMPMGTGSGLGGMLTNSAMRMMGGGMGMSNPMMGSPYGVNPYGMGSYGMNPYGMPAANPMGSLLNQGIYKLMHH
ncbi:MAG: hypothetical protein SFV17_12930 [Candidatus Obscuribacter sp.]|nr:hypothetical protein [Candidatus Obscuribacter sp.]